MEFRIDPQILCLVEFGANKPCGRQISETMTAP
jgi:hypothetical protein